MICPSCNAENRAGARGCRRCHKALPRLSPGDVVARRFEIEDLLGVGGMGVVFKARDWTLDEIVALKTLREDLEDTEEMARRFRSEITLARKISSRNVCRIHEYGLDGDLQYFSMELVKGATLKELVVRDGRMPADEVLDTMDQVAKGLSAIHDAGVMHRDVKPSNVMRTTDGHVKLMDFGIAKQVGGVTLTTAGQAIGTPEYMSPEQLLGRKLDLRTDIYTTGILMFELLTGNSPFRGENPMDSAHKQVTEMPDFETPGIPPDFVPVLRRTLAKDREERFSSARELGEALAAIRRERHSAARESADSDEGRAVAATPDTAGSSATASLEPVGTTTASGPGRRRLPTERSQAAMPPPITAALRLLREPDLASRRKAVLTLTEMGPSSPAAVQALAETLQDPDADLRYMAAAALRAIGPAAEPAVPALLNALEDEVAGFEALEALVRMGRTAVPGLLEAMNAGQGGLTARAADVLTRISARLAPPSTEQ